MNARDLGQRGGAFYRAAIARFDFEMSEAELLLETCRVLDLIETLQAEISEKGAVSIEKGAVSIGKRSKTVEKAPKTARKLPMAQVRALHGSRLLLQRLLRQLDLPDAPVEPPISLRSKRAQRAANRRWELQKGRHAAP